MSGNDSSFQSSRGTRLSALLKSSRSEVLIGRRFGDYLIESEISRGGMGMVLQARHTQTQQQVALKLLLDDQPSPESIKRFDREARVLRAMNHPNIVKILDHGHNDDVPWFAMELIAGSSLEEAVQDRLRRGLDTPLDWALPMFEDICSAVLHCHSKGILHRDLKPANIILEKATGRAVLVDFGLVKRNPHELGETFKSLELTMTKTKAMVGTPAFMSPEQLDPHGEFGVIGPKTDVWGIAISLLYTLTGKISYDQSSTTEFLAALATRDVPRLRDYRADTPRWLDGLIAEALIRDVEDRIELESLRERLQLGAAGETSRTPQVLALTLLLLTLIAAVAVAVKHRPRRKIELKRVALKKPVSEAGGQWYSKSQSVDLVGQVSESGVTVKVDGQNIEANDKGVFRCTLTREPGRHDIVIEYDRRHKQQQILSLLVDSRAPKILIAGQPRSSVMSRSTVLKGEVEDDSPVTVKIDGQAVKLNDDQSFDIAVLPSSKPQWVHIHVQDKVGHVQQQKLCIVTEQSIDALMKAHLYRAEKWQVAGEDLQDLIIAEVGARLGPGFKHRESRVFKNDLGESPRLGVFQHKATGIELHLLPGGRYTMGSKSLEAERAFSKRYRQKDFKYADRLTYEFPSHEVSIRPFLMARHEVTQEQWDLFKCPDKRSVRRDRVPIENMSWVDAQKWLKMAGGGLRLPSESEWEYACRAGSDERFFWGSDINKDYAWTELNSRERLVEVYNHFKNSRWNLFGLVDMTGNAAEWVQDYYSKSYEDGPFDEKPKVLKQRLFSLRIVRGGSVYNNVTDGRSAMRDCERQDKHFPGIGFRVACSIPESRR